MEVDVPANANGVLYALGAFSGGLSCYVKDGVLSYEYNLFEIDRTQITTPFWHHSRCVSEPRTYSTRFCELTSTRSRWMSSLLSKAKSNADISVLSDA
jgi:hypothetical protein